jgi:Flp pilus assembly pilin Flp
MYWQQTKNSMERKMHRFLTTVAKRVTDLKRLLTDSDGSVFVEYLLLLTLVGIGVIVGLAAVRTALIDELVQLATAIQAII